MGAKQTKQVEQIKKPPIKTREVYNYINGSVKQEIWYQDGCRHRDDDEPVVIDYYEDGKIKAQHWYQNGFKHRDGDKPAFIEYFRDGDVKKEEWYKGGGYGRIDDGPTRITIFKDTKFELDDSSKSSRKGYTYRLEEWHQRDKAWNNKGPHIIHYNNDIKVREVWHRVVYLSKLGKNGGSPPNLYLIGLNKCEGDFNLEYFDYFPDGKPKREFFVVE